MSDERPGEQDPPTARLNLGVVKAWLQRSAQQASADDADPAPEEAPAVPEGGPRADAVAPEGSAGPSADSGAPAKPDLHEGPPRHASEQPAAPLAEDAPAPAGFGQAGGLVPGVLPGTDDRSTIEAEAPPFEQGGTGADVHGPPGPAGGPAPDTPAEQSGDAATARSAPPTKRSHRPGGDREVGVPGEGADVPPTVSAVADAAALQEAPAHGRSPEHDDDHVAAGLGWPPPEAPGPGPSRPHLPPADPGSASADPPPAEDIGLVEGRQAEPATPPEPGEGQAGALEEAASSTSGPGDPDGQADGGAHDHGLSDTSTARRATAHADEPPTGGGTDGSDDTASRYPPAPPVPAATWLPAPAPDAAGDNGTVEHDGASSSGDEGGGAGAPDPGPSPVEASPASAEGTGADEGAGGGERADDLGSAALFELDLGKLADRARASALREAVPAAPWPLDPGPEPDPSPVTARDLQDPFLAPAPEPLPATAPAPPPFPVPVTAPSAAEDEPGQPVTPEPAPLVWGDATQAFDLSLDEDDDETDSTGADPAAGRPQGKLYAPVQAAARTRWAKRPRYPRGQLREPIGVLRRIRAMLGIVVVTVLLGVAAGMAVGAFIFFLAFAVRNAITAQ